MAGSAPPRQPSAGSNPGAVPGRTTRILRPEDRFGKTPPTVAVLNVRDGAGDVVRVLWPPAPTRTLKNLSGIGPRSLAHSITNYDLVRFFRQP